MIEPKWQNDPKVEIGVNRGLLATVRTPLNLIQTLAA